MLLAAAGVVAAAALALRAWTWPPPAPARPAVALLTIDVPDGWLMRYWDLPSVSPDSRHIAFSATGPQGRQALWVRPLGGGAARLIVANAHRPFWSPDSSAIGFFSFGKLATVPLAGGTVTELAPAPLNGGGTWMPNGDILFTPIRGRGVYRLAGGAASSQPVAVDTSDGLSEGLPWPSAVPGTDRFAFVTRRGASPELVGVIGGIEDGVSVDLGQVHSRVVATASGHLLWVRDGTLLAQRFDATRSRLVGSPAPIAQEVAVRPFSLGQFSASDDVVVFLTREASTAAVRMTMFDRSGSVVAQIGEVGEYSSPRVSPDGARIAVGRRDPRAGTRDLWIHDLPGKTPVRLTFDRHDDTAPVWSADGRAVFFTSDRKGERDLYRKDVAGQQPEVLVFASGESKSLNAVSRDGRTLVYDTGARGSVDAQGRFNSSDLRTVTLGASPTVRGLAQTPAHEDMADLSPDGSLVAYHSNGGGRTEIYVETFPDAGGRWQVTTEGGGNPVWRADGRELFFIVPEGQVAAVEVERTATGLHFGPTRVLFTVPRIHADVRIFAPFPDGRHFIVLTDADRPAPQQMTVLINWRSMLPE